MADPAVSVYAVDTGKPGDGLPGAGTTLGWAGFRDGTAVAYDRDGNHSIQVLADALVHDLDDAQRSVALGFEHVLWIPVPDEAADLLKQRRIADSAAPGATSPWCGRFAVWGLVQGLQLLSWLLSHVARRVREPLRGTTALDEWSASGCRLLVFEAFVAGRAHAAGGVRAHVQDAHTAAAAAHDALRSEGGRPTFARGPEVLTKPASAGDGRVMNLASAALAYAGLAADPVRLDEPGLLVAPQARRTGWAEA